MPLGEILGGIGTLVGAGGDIFGSLKGSQETDQNKFRRPYTGIVATPGYSFGGGVLSRRNNAFAEGQNRIRQGIQTLQGEVRPGYGRLTNTGVEAIRQQRAQGVGNLRAQLARRAVLGSSFGNDQIARAEMDYQQAEDQFRAQAFTEELSASTALIDREQASLGASLTQELQELGVGLEFLGHVNQTLATGAALDKKIAEMELLEKLNNGGGTGAAPSPAPAAAPSPVTPRPMRTPAAPAPAGGPGFVSQQRLRNA